MRPLQGMAEPARSTSLTGHMMGLVHPPMQQDDVTVPRCRWLLSTLPFGSIMQCLPITVRLYSQLCHLSLAVNPTAEMQVLNANSRALGSAARSRSCQSARLSRSALICSAAMKPHLMVNSCTGKMGQAVAEAALRAGVELVPFTLCGPGEQKPVDIEGHKIALVGPEERDAKVAELKKQYPNLMAVDYTLPDAIHSMVDFYVKHDIPFVMGTTGGDRAKINAQVEASKTYAVIAPNMGKQIVAFQAMMDMMATSFPGAFTGYKLRVIESHQSTKKDTSGTAKAVVASFQALGIPFELSQIELVREPEQQMSRMEVPESALNGHAYHTYQLVSKDGTVMFEFQHNVIGRTTYAEGTVDAVLFLARQIEQKASKTLYNMIDVLRAGAMR